MFVRFSAVKAVRYRYSNIQYDDGACSVARSFVLHSMNERILDKKSESNNPIQQVRNSPKRMNE